MRVTTKAHAASASPSFLPPPFGMLQRKCACGGAPGPTGECAECRRKRSATQGPSPLQTKLTVSQPGDRYEREADRVAAQVMRMAEPGLNRRVAEREEEEELLQTKVMDRRRAAGDVAAQPGVPSCVHDTLGSPGAHLDPSTRQFMEPRFGHDFSRVRVHTDALAAKSARAVNALAYTVGKDVVFDTGAYAPRTTAGKLLLAHELVHTIQQDSSDWIDGTSLERDKRNDVAEIESKRAARRIFQKSKVHTAKHSFINLRSASRQLEGEESEESEEGDRNEIGATTLQRVPGPVRIQRRARALWPVDRWENPAARAARGEAPGETELEMNGDLIHGSTDLDAAIPTPSIVGRSTGSAFECRVANAIDLTCRNRRIMPWADENGAWWSRIGISVLQGLGISQCAGMSAPNGVRFKLTATPSARALTRRVIQSEYEHVMDTFETFRAHLVPLHDRYAHHASNVTTGSDGSTCASSILNDINRNQRINDFLADYIARQQAHDGPGGDHQTEAPMSVNAGCTLAHARAEVT